jgi:hypothetical protein
MKVILHDEQTDLYYAGCNNWVNNLEHGFDFGSIQLAIQAKQQKQLPATGILVISEATARTIRFSMSEIPLAS